VNVVLSQIGLYKENAMKAYWRAIVVLVLVAGGVLTLAYAQVPGNADPNTRPVAPRAENVAETVPAPPTSAAPVTQPPGFGTLEARSVYDPKSGAQIVQLVTPEGKVVSTYRGAPGGTAYYTVPVPHDPETAKLHAEEEAAAKESQELVGQVRAAKDEKEKGDAANKLREALSKQFDAQQKRRALEIGKIEERLGKLKDTMKKRETAKDTIVGRRLDELTGVTDELGWEETGGAGRYGTGGGPNFYVPGNVPAVPPPAGFPPPRTTPANR
jgi:hypothetical protein